MLKLPLQKNAVSSRYRNTSGYYWPGSLSKERLFLTVTTLSGLLCKSPGNAQDCGREQRAGFASRSVPDVSDGHVFRDTATSSADAVMVS